MHLASGHGFTHPEYKINTGNEHASGIAGGDRNFMDGIMKTEFVDFTEDIIVRALDGLAAKPVLMLFPTRQSKLRGMQMFQPRWDFTPHVFFTMDEWKESLQQHDRPLLREEKRTLTLYQSLSDEDKDFFHCHDYFLSIELAHQFFDFWQELAEECVEMDSVEKVLLQKQTAGDWQWQTFQRMRSIRDAYRAKLDDIHATDAIFSAIDVPTLSSDFAEIRVVNQFYFTALEKQLLSHFDEIVTIYVQGPSSCYDSDRMQLTEDFGAHCLPPDCNERITVITSADEWEMLARMAELSKSGHPLMIDFKPNRQPYAGMLSPKIFSQPADTTFAATALYQFLQLVLDVYHSRVFDGSPFLLSLPALVQLFNADTAVSAMAPQAEVRQSIRQRLFYFIERSYQFIDFRALEREAPEVRSTIMQVFHLVRRLDDVTDIPAFTSLLLQDFRADVLLASDAGKTDIYTQFYASLADFATLDEAAVIISWKRIFPTHTGAQILRLFLDYLKAKKLRYHFDDLPKHRIQCTSLQDTRNMNYPLVFVLNVVEGILPAARQQQFLLSEQQRKTLGLKTYGDIRLRDKYYFYRLLAGSGKSVLFTRLNSEKNIEVSSFVEELLLQGMAAEQPSPPLPSANAAACKALLGSADAKYAPCQLEDDFFSFTFDPGELAENTLPLSPTSWQQLAANPFEFYIQYIGSLRERAPRLDTDYTARLTGIISHGVFENIWQRLIEVYEGNKMHHNFLHTARNHALRGIQHYLTYDRNFRYYSPHNYSDIYFHKVFIPLLQRGVERFFYALHNQLHLSDTPLEVFIEGRDDAGFSLAMPHGVIIRFTGRPDLRIHTENGARIIIDYKTGAMDASRLKKYTEQLQFYELMFYPQRTGGEDLESYLWFIEQKQMHRITNRISLEEAILEVWDGLEQDGFVIPPRRAPYERTDITRRDKQGDIQ